jgi:hypothetical protein
MARTVHEIQGYSIVTDKVAFLTRVFKSDGEEGYQFNIAFTGDVRLSPRFATRHEAELERELFLKAIREV